MENKGRGQTALTPASAGRGGVEGGEGVNWGVGGVVEGAEIDPRCSAHARIGEESALGEVTPMSEAVRVNPSEPLAGSSTAKTRNAIRLHQGLNHDVTTSAQLVYCRRRVRMEMEAVRAWTV